MNINNILIGFVIGLTIGVIVGYFVGNRKTTVTFKVLVGSVTIALWSLSIIVSIIDRTFEVPTLLHGIAGGIVTALFGEELLDKKNKK